MYKKIDKKVKRKKGEIKTFFPFPLYSIQSGQESSAVLLYAFFFNQESDPLL